MSLKKRRKIKPFNTTKIITINHHPCATQSLEYFPEQTSEYNLCSMREIFSKFWIKK